MYAPEYDSMPMQATISPESNGPEVRKWKESEVTEKKRLTNHVGFVETRNWETWSSQVATNLYPPSSSLINMADSKKQEKDFTKEVDALIPEAQTLARVSILRFIYTIDRLLLTYNRSLVHYKKLLINYLLRRNRLEMFVFVQALFARVLTNLA
jgi:hypothetical protein